MLHVSPSNETSMAHSASIYRKQLVFNTSCVSCSHAILIRGRTTELFLRKTILEIDPLVLIGVVLAIGIVLAVLAFVFYRRSFARREATQPPLRPPPAPQ